MDFIPTGMIAAINAIDTTAGAIARIPASAQRLAHQLATADTSAWAARIERSVRVAAVVFAFLFAIGAITAEALYNVGGQFRRALDSRNDQLAAFWVRLWVAPPAPSPVMAMVVIEAPVVTAAPLPAAPLLLAPAPAAPLLAPAAPRPARRARRSRRALEVAAA
jgi:hypothetical protein